MTPRQQSTIDASRPLPKQHWPAQSPPQLAAGLGPQRPGGIPVSARTNRSGRRTLGPRAAPADATTLPQALAKLKSLERQKRDHTIMQMAARGHSDRDIASRFGLSRRHIIHIIHKQRRSSIDWNALATKPQGVKP